MQCSRCARGGVALNGENLCEACAAAFVPCPQCGEVGDSGAFLGDRCPTCCRAHYTDPILLFVGEPVAENAVRYILDTYYAPSRVLVRGYSRERYIIEWLIGRGIAVAYVPVAVVNLGDWERYMQDILRHDNTLMIGIYPSHSNLCRIPEDPLNKLGVLRRHIWRVEGNEAILPLPDADLVIRRIAIQGGCE